MSNSMKDSLFCFPRSTRLSNIVDIRPTRQGWPQLTSIARFKWKRLTHKDLDDTEGRRQRLVDLVSSRYLISQDEAEQQVQDFFASNNMSIIFTPIECQPGH